MSASPIPVLWLSGPPGVGKTAVAWKIYTGLTESGIQAAYLDIDQLGVCYPEPPSDPGRHSMQATNARALIDNFRDAGARCVVISGVIDLVHGFRSEEFHNQAVTVCWLAASADELRRRFKSRGTPQNVVEAAIRDVKNVDASLIADLVIETDGLSVDEVTGLVRQQTVGWPGFTTQGDAPSSERRSRRITKGGSVLFLCGARGVGKSSVAFAVYLKVLRAGLMTAYVDVDQLAFFSGGRADHGLRAQNLASVWNTYREAGARGLVTVANIEDESVTSIYEDELPDVRFTWCRLHAGPERLTERIFRRGQGQGSWPEPGDSLRGQPSAALLQLARESEAIANSLEHWSTAVRVDTDHLPIEEAADVVIESTRWLESFASE